MQNVIVTGGNRGLGLAMVRTLAAAGYRIIVLARGNSEELTAAVRDAADSGRGTIEFRVCDLSELEYIGPLVKALREDFGPLYGLVNNAGLGTGGLLSTMHDQRYPAFDSAQYRLSHFAVEIRRSIDDRAARRPDCQCYLDRGRHRLQPALGLQRHQSLADRVHTFAGARGRAAWKTTVTTDAGTPA